MAILLHLTALLGLSATAFAQSSQIVWGSVLYTFYGEKTPSLTTGPYNLSPLGANQMLNAGQFVRSRNIEPPSNVSQPSQVAPINGISVNSIDNSQLLALSTDAEFISASAMAFFQGLYPPRGFPIIDSEDTLANGTNVGYPLDGYQYPNIGTVSELDYNYIWIAGNIGCTNWAIAQVEELETPSYSQQIVATQPFYDSLAPTVFGDYEPSIINYGNAWILYEYALYQFNHNQSNPISSEDLSQLYNLASQQQFEFNSPNIFGTIPSIAGQTIASAVLQQLQHIIASGGVEDKLTVLFGSFEPILAFFALSNLSTGPSGELFTTLPPMAPSWPSSSSPIPPPPPTRKISLYPSPPTTSSSSCESITLFCEAILVDVSNGTNTTPTTAGGKKTLSPTIGGVIGAVVTLAVALLVFLILGLCGFRLGHHEKRAKGVAMPDVGGIAVLKRSGSGMPGGFKGAEKLASDTDLRLKSGAGASVIRHERVGSWELNESPTSDGKNASLDKDIESGRMERVVNNPEYGRRSEDYDVNPFGDPVKPMDQV